jgi:hypothetical protein
MGKIGARGDDSRLQHMFNRKVLIGGSEFEISEVFRVVAECWFETFLPFFFALVLIGLLFMLKFRSSDGIGKPGTNRHLPQACIAGHREMRSIVRESKARFYSRPRVLIWR